VENIVLDTAKASMVLQMIFSPCRCSDPDYEPVFFASTIETTRVAIGVSQE
jgi:hypothetical protein